MPHFPIVEKLVVNRYELYPGESGGGISHQFQDGINVVLGINGLGKTTLLTMMLKNIVGPVGLPGDGRLGSAKRTPRLWSRSYFSARVQDSAADATSVLSFKLGDNAYRITRRLKDLSVVEFELNEEKVWDPTFENQQAFEDAYRASVCTSGGYCDFFDFLLVCERLVFLIDQRTFAIWDEEAQAELIRVLFFDPSYQTKYIELFNEVVEADSTFRNARAALNKLERAVAREQRKKATATRTVGDLQKHLNNLQQQFADKAEEASKIYEERLAKRNRLEELKQKKASLIIDRDSIVEEYLSCILPNASDNLLFIIETSAENKRCLACGSEHRELITQLVQNSKSGTCPICGTGNSAITTEHGADLLRAKLSESDELLSRYSEEITDATRGLAELDSKYRTIRPEAIRIEIEANQTEHDLSEAMKAAGFKEDEKKTSASRQQLEEFKNILDSKAGELRALCTDAITKIFDEGIGDKVRDEFNSFVTKFIPEASKISFIKTQRQVGQQAGSVPFPKFTVSMTSGTFRDVESIRTSSSDVSESQAILLDLAFRMALIKVAASKHNAMLVLDTPESSLDTVFMEFAGEELASLANDGNRIIASSNLSRERLVPSMFGIPPWKRFEAASPETKQEMRGKIISRSERANRVLDLLRLGAAGAALEQHRERYEEARDEGLFPDWLEADYDN